MEITYTYYNAACFYKQLGKPEKNETILSDDLPSTKQGKNLKGYITLVELRTTGKLSPCQYENGRDEKDEQGTSMEPTATETNAGSEASKSVQHHVKVTDQNQEIVGDVIIHKTQEGEEVVKPKAANEKRPDGDGKGGRGDNADDSSDTITTDEAQLKRKRSLADVICCRKNTQ